MRRRECSFSRYGRARTNAYACSDKRGHIRAHQPRILERPGIDGERFIGYGGRLFEEFGTAVEAPATLVNLWARRNQPALPAPGAAREPPGRAESPRLQHDGCNLNIGLINGASGRTRAAPSARGGRKP